MLNIPRKASIVLLTLVSCLLVLITPVLAQRSIDLARERWLRVRDLSGEVYFFTEDTRQLAAAGDILAIAGDGVKTGSDSSCTLEFDINIGTIELRENTELIIRSLDYASDDGRVTYLSVPYGNVILNLRKFTNPGSVLEIETPSGVSGVRGTEFGMIVHPDSQSTSVATQSGAVFAAAQGTEVDVPGGFQTLIPLGEPPLEPIPIPDVPQFDFRIEQQLRDYVRYTVLFGQIDPINQVYVEDELQEVTDAGTFQYESAAYLGASVQIKIVTPLGQTATYDIPLL
ncbi:MAG: FecR domain-containing protein [Leptolyngbyaceae cyanobacterium]